MNSEEASGNLVVGAGAIGTVLATCLDAARQPVRLAIRPEDIDSIGRASELRVDRVTGRAALTAPKPRLSTNPRPEAGENLFLCVKHRDLDSVLDALPQTLPEGVTLIPCLNGVGVARALRRRWPQTPVAAMTILFHAQLLEPLHARITTKPQALLNTHDKALLHLFDGSALRLRRAEDESLAWGRLLFNLGSALCALCHASTRELLSDPELSACYTALLDEATTVLDAAAIRYSLPLALPYPAFRALLRHGGPLAWWLARLRLGLSEDAYPSMVTDVLLGNQTEVEQLNGEIVRLAESTGLKAPLNRRLVELVSELEGEAQDRFLTADALRKRLAEPARR